METGSPGLTSIAGNLILSSSVFATKFMAESNFTVELTLKLKSAARIGRVTICHLSRRCFVNKAEGGHNAAQSPGEPGTDSLRRVRTVWG